MSLNRAMALASLVFDDIEVAKPVEKPVRVFKKDLIKKGDRFGSWEVITEPYPKTVKRKSKVSGLLCDSQIMHVQIKCRCEYGTIKEKRIYDVSSHESCLKCHGSWMGTQASKTLPRRNGTYLSKSYGSKFS